MLRAVESSATQSLRLTLTRQLAEVLLRGVSGAVYSCPERVTETTGQFQHLCQSSFWYQIFMPEVSHLRLAGSIVGYSACVTYLFYIVQIQNFVNMGIPRHPAIQR